MNEQTITNQLSFWQQVYRHRLSLISLFIAITSLGYNTWRNESTEAHRNTREAAFTILKELGELQQIVSYRHYFYSRAKKDDLPAYEDGDWVRGWSKVILIDDLSNLLSNDTREATSQLRDNWQRYASQLELGPKQKQGQQAQEFIMQHIDATRTNILNTLNALE